MIAVGIDPSSSKIAAVVSKDGKPIDYKVLLLPAKQPAETCLKASKFVEDLLWGLQYPTPNWRVEKPLSVYAFLESPVYAPKAGPGSLIPQAQVSGAILAACGHRGVPVELVEPTVWKKDVLDNGGASKPVIAKWVRMRHRAIYLAAQADQDVCDALCISVFGTHFVERLRHMNVPRIRKAP